MTRRLAAATARGKARAIENREQGVANAVVITS
jgi:hypothetical protein